MTFESMYPDTIRPLLPYIQWLGILSGITFALSLIILPLMISRLPEDFFLEYDKKIHPTRRKPGGIILVTLGNTLGIVLFSAGIIMLFLPGQGILTMVMGLACMSFPGKHALISRVSRNISLQKSLNWTRKKMAKSPFLWE